MTFCLTPQTQSSLQGRLLLERVLKYCKERSMRVRRECKMQNFVSFVTVLIENFENKLWTFFFGWRGHPNHLNLKKQKFFGRMAHAAWGVLWNWTLQIILSFIKVSLIHLKNWLDGNGISSECNKPFMHFRFDLEALDLDEQALELRRADQDFTP